MPTATNPNAFDPTPAPSRTSPAKAWARALELTAPIPGNPRKIFSTVIEDLAAILPNQMALISDRESLTYRELSDRSNQYARWALAQGLGSGKSVSLMMPNRPEYMAIWLGITSTGCTVALLNTNLIGASLAHCINILAPAHMIVAAELLDQFTSAAHLLQEKLELWVHGPCQKRFRRIDRDVDQYPSSELTDAERDLATGGPVTIKDRALCIYTSGTTGLPKAANVSHARIMQWSHWFAGMLQTGQSDRLYNCLPMYHSVGGIVATGSVLATGGSVVLREQFSASQFWDDIIRWDCTIFQYIGELCRYLFHAAATPFEAQHRIRICCGNGLRADIWDAFKSKFRIPQILEFYASTEGNVSLFNAEGTTGSIGRIPPYVAHRFPTALVKFDIDNAQPARNQDGHCIRCDTDEAGEAIGRISASASAIASQFEGYTDEKAGADKVLRNVFEAEDSWFRTGDLMRKDNRGYFYFVDRIGDTFRWKGENVATTEVSEAISAFAGVREAVVYGVPVPGTDGRAGMASLVTGDALDLGALRTHLVDLLPDYAHPRFVRILKSMDVTATFKYTKAELSREGYNPHRISDPIYFNHPDLCEFVPLSLELYDCIQSRSIRV